MMAAPSHASESFSFNSFTSAAAAAADWVSGCLVVAQLVKEVLEISVLVREVMSFELGLDPDGGDGEVPGCGECRPAREHEGQLWIAMDYIKITMDPQIVSVRKVTRIDLAVMGALAAPRPT